MRKGGKNGNKNDNQNCRSLWGVDDQFDTSLVCDLVHQKAPGRNGSVLADDRESDRCNSKCRSACRTVGIRGDKMKERISVEEASAVLGIPPTRIRNRLRRDYIKKRMISLLGMLTGQKRGSLSGMNCINQ